MTDVLPRNRDIACGAAITALGVWLSVEATAIPPGPGHTLIGPDFFPHLIGGGLTLSGLVILGQGLRRGWRSAEAAQKVHLGAFLRMVAVLLAYVLLYQPLGFIVATALVVPAGARVFGSARPLRDGLVGIGVAVAAWFLFTRLIGLELPAGWLLQVVLPGGG
ncbi:MAG: tripartite tricarboxylate transporter TctB family protein [Acetobacterales bacterium]